MTRHWKCQKTDPEFRIPDRTWKECEFLLSKNSSENMSLYCSQSESVLRNSQLSTQQQSITKLSNSQNSLPEQPSSSTEEHVALGNRSLQNLPTNHEFPNHASSLSQHPGAPLCPPRYRLRSGPSCWLWFREWISLLASAEKGNPLSEPQPAAEGFFFPRGSCLRQVPGKSGSRVEFWIGLRPGG